MTKTINAEIWCGCRHFFQELNPRGFYRIDKVSSRGEKSPFSEVFRGEEFPAIDCPYDEEVDMVKAHLEVRRIRCENGKRGKDHLKL